MCGITGIFAYSNAAPPVNSQELLQIREVMTARGPDDAGIWLSERIGLAHRRLSIIDLTKMGTQPMTTQDGIFRIVFNGIVFVEP
jgi:asparagine synthase (glutamine-hydrolysing)